MSKTTKSPEIKSEKSNVYSFDDAEIRRIVERINRISANSILDVDRSPGELCFSAAARINSASGHIVLAGVELLAAKVRCRHGEFTEIKKKSGISEWQAKQAMLIVRWLGGLSEQRAVQILKTASPSKMRELARVDPEILEAEYEDDADPDGILAMPVRKVAAHIRNLERETARTKKRNDDLEAAAADRDGPAAWVSFSEIKMRDFRAATLRVEDGFEQIEAALLEWTRRRRPKTVHGHRVNKLNAGVRKDLTALQSRAQQMLDAVNEMLGGSAEGEHGQ